tara:strand:+ start:1982 stop:2617 length:636 start_codon:yes stop_codon:yes gene_type:complete
MNESDKGIKIQEENNKYTLIISEQQMQNHPEFCNSYFIKTLKKMLLTNAEIQFHKLDEYFKTDDNFYLKLTIFIKEIIKQINYLESNDLCYLYLNISDIIVCNNHFFLIKTDNLFRLTEQDGGKVLYFQDIHGENISDNVNVDFVSQEVRDNTTSLNKQIPISYSKTVMYESLGKLVYALSKDKNISDTAVEYFINRTLSDSPNDRILNFI